MATQQKMINNEEISLSCTLNLFQGAWPHARLWLSTVRTATVQSGAIDTRKIIVLSHDGAAGTCAHECQAPTHRRKCPKPQDPTTPRHNRQLMCPVPLRSLCIVRRCVSESLGTQLQSSFLHEHPLIQRLLILPGLRPPPRTFPLKNADARLRNVCHEVACLGYGISPAAGS